MKLVALLFAPLWLAYANPIETRGNGNAGCLQANGGCPGTCVSPKNGNRDYCAVDSYQFPCGVRNFAQTFCGTGRDQGCIAFGDAETYCPSQ